MNSSPFFKPTSGWVGDVIPFERDGEFWLFYLHELRESPKPGTPWRVVVTRDFVDFEDRGVALPNGDASADDFNAYTGSVVVDDSGLHHLFYTGQNPNRHGADGLPLQVVMHATSDGDLLTWNKRAGEVIGASTGYETADWRDPFVFKTDDGVWRMLLAARHTEGPARRRGVIAQLTSTDLATWTPADPFWDPRRYITHECPDVFRWGDWWYLVYSEFSESFTTRYRMARSPLGPWQVPEHDSVDGRAFYASKSVALGDRRFFCGWIATKCGQKDDGAWEWAGTLSTLEARQAADGTLEFGLLTEVVASYAEKKQIELPAELPLELSAPDGYRAVLTKNEIPARCLVRAVIDIAPDTTEAGLLLRASADGDESYVVRLEPKRSRLVFDRWPRALTGDAQWHVSGDVPFEIELERPCDLSPGAHVLEVILHSDLCVVSLDSKLTLSTRIYDHPSGRLGVFVGEGAAILRSLEVHHQTPPQHR